MCDHKENYLLDYSFNYMLDIWHIFPDYFKYLIYFYMFKLNVSLKPSKIDAS